MMFVDILILGQHSKNAILALKCACMVFVKKKAIKEDVSYLLIFSMILLRVQDRCITGMTRRDTVIVRIGTNWNDIYGIEVYYEANMSYVPLTDL